MTEAGKTAGTGKWWLLIASCCLGLVLAELLAGFALRYREWRNSPSWAYATFFPVFDDASDRAGLYVAHPYWAYDMKPNYGEITNDLGFRGPPMEPRKQAGSLRVVCLGGSTTYGIRNDWEFSYPKLLGDELVARLGPRVEVANAGLVSATTAESAHRLIGKILPLDPDMVIIYHAVNDLGPRVLDDPAVDYSAFRRVPLDRFHGLYPWLNRSNLVGLLKNVLPREDLHRYTLNYAAVPESEARRVENFRRNGSSSFERNINLMIHVLLAYGVEPVVPTFAFHEPNTDRWLDIVPEEVWEEGIREHNAVIRTLVEEHDLVPVPFYEHALGHRKWFSGQVHMTDRGNEEKARFFAKHIEPVLRERLASGTAFGSEP